MDRTNRIEQLLDEASTELSNKLSSQERRKINADFDKMKQRFNRIGQGLAAISDVLDKHGLEQAQAFSGFRERVGETINYRFDLARSHPTDPFSPQPIHNSMLVISVYWLGKPDRYEILAYVS